MIGIFIRLITLPLYLLFGSGTKNGGFSIPTLAMTGYEFYPKERKPNGLVLELVGRRRGFGGWMMDKLGIVSRYYIRVTNQEIQVSVGSMAGSQNFIAPLSQITASDFALQKNVWQLYAACFFLLVALPLLPTIIGSVVAIIIALFLFWRYNSSSRMLVAFSTSDIPDLYGLAFEPKGKVDFDTLHSSIQHVNRSILKAHTPTQ